MTRVARPAVRLRPVPPLDPPFDDELAPEIWSSAPHPGQLVLNLANATAVTRGAGPTGDPPLPDPPLPDSARAPRPGAQSPVPNAGAEARQAAKRFLAACLEILNGYRPLGHIRPLVTPTETDTAIAQLGTGIERLAGPRRTGRRAPAKVRLVRVCEPRPGVVEVAAALGDPARTWALAFRLERHQGKWLAATVRVL